MTTLTGHSPSRFEGLVCSGEMRTIRLSAMLRPEADSPYALPLGPARGFLLCVADLSPQADFVAILHADSAEGARRLRQAWDGRTPACTLKIAYPFVASRNAMLIGRCDPPSWLQHVATGEPEAVCDLFAALGH